MLRDPVERWYSEYYYNRHKKEGVGKTSLGIEAYLESEAGHRYARSFINYFTDAADPSAKATEAEARQAVEALTCFDVVGSLEDLNAFREGMRRRFGRRPFFPHVNRSPAKGDSRKQPDRHSEVHRQLLELLEPDIFVYETVQGIEA